MKINWKDILPGPPEPAEEPTEWGLRLREVAALERIAQALEDIYQRSLPLDGGPF